MLTLRIPSIDMRWVDGPFPKRDEVSVRVLSDGAGVVLHRQAGPGPHDRGDRVGCRLRAACRGRPASGGGYKLDGPLAVSERTGGRVRACMGEE
jgi:hypothetical protein